MFTSQSPVVGTWSVHQTGKLIKVRVLVFEETGLKKVMVEYLDGSKTLVVAEDWFCLKLNSRIHEAGQSMILH